MTSGDPCAVWLVAAHVSCAMHAVGPLAKLCELYHSSSGQPALRQSCLCRSAVIGEPLLPLLCSMLTWFVKHAVECIFRFTLSQTAAGRPVGFVVLCDVPCLVARGARLACAGTGESRERGIEGLNTSIANVEAQPSYCAAHASVVTLAMQLKEAVASAGVSLACCYLQAACSGAFFKRCAPLTGVTSKHWQGLQGAEAAHCCSMKDPSLSHKACRLLADARAFKGRTWNHVCIACIESCMGTSRQGTGILALIVFSCIVCAPCAGLGLYLKGLATSWYCFFNSLQCTW